MQIDFHHGATYVVARLAGFNEHDAQIIAYSAQYVDDATNEGTIEFTNGAQYTRIASAHKLYDPLNFDRLRDVRVWLPFHFLPGNLGEPAPETQRQLPHDAYVERLVCRPNSFVAREMMADVISRQARPYSLHRLGIASHVFIDTWAHQGFVGYPSPRNLATDLSEPAPLPKELGLKLRIFWSRTVNRIKSLFVGQALPLGHGTVLGFPDQPFLEWSYTNGLGEKVVRNNPRDFSEAIRNLYVHYKRYQAFSEHKDRALTMDCPIPAQFAILDKMLRDITDTDGERRHKVWLKAIGDGTFGFSDNVSYVGKGPGSWKHEAVGNDKTFGDTTYEFSPDFLQSNWKLFHDALQIHRLHIVNELLPRFGLVAA